MLQRVGMGQLRFNVPGLVADSRGVVAGRQIVLRFSALERLISFLRLWSGEQALDDFQPGLRIVQVRTASGTREALVIVPATSMPLIDAAARAARTAGGQCFTGAGKHFVQFGDARAPLGYDVVALEPADDATDFVLYSQDHTQTVSVLGELPLDKLLLRLDLQRQQQPTSVRRDLLFVTVRRGLGPLAIAYLYRAERQNPGLRAAAALCEPPVEGSFQRASSFWMLRLEEVPARLLGVLSRTPGFSLMVPVADNVAVAFGYRHPVHLGSCKQSFPSDRFFLFGPAPSGVTIVNPAPVFSPVADLVRLQPQLPAPVPAPVATSASTSTSPGREAASSVLAGAQPQLSNVRPAAPPELIVPLRLEAAPAGGDRAVATLVPWERVGWIRSLCYALPATAVRGYRVAFLARGVLIIAPDTLDAFPFGLLLHAPAPGLLVPLGYELRPAVSPDELSARVGAAGGSLVVFPGPEQAPFRIPADSIVTLEAKALADPSLDDLRVEESLAGETSVEEGLDVDVDVEIEIENQPLGPMPLWRIG